MQDNIAKAKIDLIAELGIDQLPEDKKEEVLIQIGEIVQQRIIERFVKEMPEDKADQFLAMIADEATEQSAVDAFVAENVPQADEFVLEEIAQYKEESLNLFKDIAGKTE